MGLYGIAFWVMEWISLSDQGGRFHAFVNSVVGTSLLKKGKLFHSTSWLFSVTSIPQ